MAKKENDSKNGAAERHAQDLRTQAEERTAAHQALNPEEKLAKLDERPGESKRERARIGRTK